MLNLDTHILIYALSSGLEPREKRLLSGEEWGISGIVLWELEKLSQLGRIKLELTDAQVVRVLSKIHVWPIDLTVCRELRKVDFKSDPADEIIAATSLAHGVKLLTRDRRIRASKIVPLA